MANDVPGGQQSDGRARIDARPIRKTSTDTSWDHAVVARDALSDVIRATLDQERVRALVFASGNGNYPPWVKLEAWLPGESRGQGHERSELLVVVDVKPYHRHALVISVQATRGARSIRVEERPRFPPADIADWTRYVIGHAAKPASYHPFRDALAALFRRRRNPIERAYRTGFWSSTTGPLSLGALLAMIAGFAVFAATPPLGVVLILAGAAGLIAAGVLANRRERAIFVPSQSVVAPRNLGLVDSWHAAVADLGRDFDDIRGRLVACVTDEQAAGLTCGMETYGYRTPYGFEERERLVVSKGQCVVQVHVYRFSDDLFVGWHAYLNWAQWAELAPVSTRIEHGQHVEFRELRQGYYVPNQFDLIDLNSLSELVHRRLERELKAILKEEEIDQEIDFKVIRGDRDVALDKAKHADQGTSRRGWRYLST